MNARRTALRRLIGWSLRVAALGLVALALIVGAVTQHPARAEAPALVRLAYVDDWRALPAVVAVERGFFAAQGLIASGLPMTADRADFETSLAEGTTDLALIPQRLWLAMADSAADTVSIGVGSWGIEMELVVREGRPIDAIADLKNRRVAISSGSPAYPTLIRLLNQVGLEPQNVRVLELPTAEVLSSFQRRRADAVFDVRHVTTPLAAEGGRVLVDWQALLRLLGPINAVPLVARAEWAAEQPETLRRVAVAWVHTLAYIEANRDDAARLLYMHLRRRGVRLTSSLAEAWVGFSRYDLPGWSDAAIRDAEYNAWALMTAGELTDMPALPARIDTGFIAADSTP